MAQIADDGYDGPWSIYLSEKEWKDIARWRNGKSGISIGSVRKPKVLKAKYKHQGNAGNARLRARKRNAPNVIANLVKYEIDVTEEQKRRILDGELARDVLSKEQMFAFNCAKHRKRN